MVGPRRVRERRRSRAAPACAGTRGRVEVSQSVAETWRQHQVRIVHRRHQWNHRRGHAARSADGSMNRDTRADDLLDLAIRGSLGGRIVSALAGSTAKVWGWSSARRVVSMAAANWQALEAPQKVRAVASAGAIAMVVHKT